jgi:hypothetical protein
MADVHVLLVYSLVEQRLIDQEEFDDGERAMSRYFEVERDHRDDKTVEIVLIAADSLDTIRYTHASYFRGEVGAPALDLAALFD